MTYPYAGRDLFAEPERYMYSAFGGRPFLDDYLAFRRLAAERRSEDVREAFVELTGMGCGVLAARLGLENDAPVEVGGTPEALPFADNWEAVATLPALARLAVEVVGGDEGSSFGFWLDFFIQRFEVSRRLFGGYAPPRKPNGEECGAVAYALLAWICMVHYAATGNLKHLNVALKVGDALQSVSDRLTGGALVLAREAASMELDAVRGLMAAREVL